MPRGNRGVVLLDVLAALVIVGIAGTAALELAAAWSRSVSESASRERELADEERLLSAWSLLDRHDLDLRQGSRDEGGFRITVMRPAPTLYRLAVGRMSGPGVEDIVTIVFRPEPPRAP